MKISARNVLRGKVVKIVEGQVTAEVQIDIGGKKIITSIISLASLKDLNLRKGQNAYAIIKSTEVMIGK